MKLLGMEITWEAIQTLMLWARNRAPAQGGGAASSAEKKEDSLQQQLTSVLPTRDDEAILMAIDAALVKMEGGLNHLRNIRFLRANLEPHQLADWRKNIGTIKLTERFEQALASETITRGGNRADPNQPGAQQPRGQERIERKFERRQRDYEWTKKDPRVRHLILISQLVETDGIEAAKGYLITGGFIAKQSSAQRAAATASQGKDAMIDAIHRFVGKVESTDPELRRLEAAIKAAPNADAKRQLEDELRRFLRDQSQAANTGRKEKDRAATRRFRIFIGLTVIAAITFAVLA